MVVRVVLADARVWRSIRAVAGAVCSSHAMHVMWGMRRAGLNAVGVGAGSQAANASTLGPCTAGIGLGELQLGLRLALTNGSLTEEIISIM